MHPRLLSLAALSPAAALAQATFTPLPYLSDTVPYAQAFGLSADGSTAVGSSLLTGGLAAQSGAAIWHSGGVTYAYGPAGASATAAAASSTASTIVGWADYGAFSPLGIQAFANILGNPQLLGDFPSNPTGVPRSFARALSADGSIIVGIGTSIHGTEAFRYDVSAATFTGLGSLSAATFGSWAYGVSADGSIIVGASYSAPAQSQGFRWTAATGMAALPFLPTPAGTQRYAIAEGISASGAVIFGESRSVNSGNAMEAFRWTSDGIIGLGDLPGGAFQSWAYAASADGSVIVGRATIDGPTGPFGGGSAPRPFIWDAAHGLRDLQQALADAGIDLTGWQLQEARGLSADGRTIAGTGTNPSNQTQAWIATLPPPPCYANCDNSTTPPILNIADFGCFINRFQSGDTYANCDGSTTEPVLNVNDFICFINRFAAGCS